MKQKANIGIIMRIRGKLFFPVILVFSQSLIGQNLILEFTEDEKAFVIRHEGVVITSEWVAPSVQPDATSVKWTHNSKIVSPSELAGMMGTRTTDLFTGNGLEMERQVWLSDDKNTAAVRQKLVNRSSDSIRLRNMVPLACRSANSFRIIKIPDPSGWNILVQKRHKNDIPESLVPTSNMSVRVDPFLIAPLGSDPNGQALLIGYLNQNEHLAHIELSFREDHGHVAFNTLEGLCEFNDIIVPREERLPHSGSVFQRGSLSKLPSGIMQTGWAYTIMWLRLPQRLLRLTAPGITTPCITTRKI